MAYSLILWTLEDGRWHWTFGESGSDVGLRHSLTWAYLHPRRWLAPYLPSPYLHTVQRADKYNGPPCSSDAQWAATTGEAVCPWTIYFLIVVLWIDRSGELFVSLGF